MVRIIELIIRAIIKIIKFFGLWVPILYIIFGIILAVYFNFSPLAFDTLSILYIIGFVGSLVCCLIITFRSIFINPFKAKIELNRTKKELKKFIESENLREREFHIKRQESLTQKEQNLAKKEWELEQKLKRLSKKRSRSERKLFPKLREDELDFSYIDKKTEQEIKPRKTKINTDYIGSERVPEYRRPSIIEDERMNEREEKPAIYSSALDPNLLIHEFKDRFVVYREEGSRLKLEKVEYK